MENADKKTEEMISQPVPAPEAPAPAAEAAPNSNKKRFTKNLIVKSGTDLFMPFMLMIGLYVILHGDTNPGGGFQGGVLIASAVLMIYLGYGTKVLRQVFHLESVIKIEALSLVVYFIIAFFVIFLGKAAATNIIFHVGSIEMETATLMSDMEGVNVSFGVGALLLMLIGAMRAGTGEEPDQTESGEDK